MNKTFLFIMLGGTFFSAISQILLKQSANIKYSNPLREYLNWRVILAYFLFFWYSSSEYLVLHKSRYALRTGH